MSVSATKKGWLEGLKFAFIISIFLLLFQILGIDKSFHIKRFNILFYSFSNFYLRWNDWNSFYIT